MEIHSRAHAVVHLDHIAYNMEQMYANLHPDTGIIAVIKEDAYGHGAVTIGHMMERIDYVWGYATASLEEARQLQNAGLKKPVLVLGCIFPEQYSEMLKREIRVNIYTEEMAKEISRIATKSKKIARAHIKLDTGMSRLGFAPCEETIQAIKRISKLPGIYLEGFFTHFSKADEADKSFTNDQINRYNDMLKRLKKEGIRFDYMHCSNSAAIIDMPNICCNLVRAGIALYGLYPSDEVDKESTFLKPALELKARVAMIKEIEPGTPISYGATFYADKKMKIATISVGYGDGYPRLLSNKGYVLIHGERANIVGRICMDYFMVDVTHIDQVEFGDQVTLIGWDNGKYLAVEELGKLSGRFNYEFVCDLNKRIPRIYDYKGKVVTVVEYF